MGHREVKRVPLDFNAPLNQTWSGYQPPAWRDCPANCINGQTVAGRYLEMLTHLILLLGDDARRPDHVTHPWLRAIPLGPGRKPSSDALELSRGLAGRSGDLLGHDAIDRWTATKKIITAAGLDPKVWGTCKVCKGDAIHPDDAEAADKWERTDPPTGEGWQLWETVSEGSPLSPVFQTPNALAEWAEAHATPFAGFRWTAKQWLDSFLAGTTDVDTMMVGGPGGFTTLGP